ncbi:MarR family winged helix-turn-helix transcriptional regulator [Pacificoceanicola onchidii]|uniref:MarR family winged helix-turn-helix transcriptional regulator n=1 Tax=Pacificoceanicola onchidii TaxID=2562685 RepID=UPI0010A6120E|nr:MarR family transcriptional regulator [Pacificoceanicola onchidii]
MDDIDRIIAQWTAERPDLDVGPMALIGRLARLAKAVAEAHGKVFEKHGLSAAGFDVLATLRRAGPPHALDIKSLLASTMVTSGTMTNRLDKLEKAGLLARQPNPGDGRGFIVKLTDQGFQTIDAAVTEHVANQHALVASLNPDERKALNALLRTWGAGLQKD